MALRIRRSLLRYFTIAQTAMMLLAGFILAASPVASSLTAEERRDFTYLGVEYIDDVCGALTTLVGKDNIQKAYNYFVSKGLTPFQSAGVVGNLMQESGVNPASNNTAAKASSVSPSTFFPGLSFLGGGIAQWEDSSDPGNPGGLAIPGRWTGQSGYLKYAQTNNKPWDDLGAQLDFLWSEMPNQFAHGKLGELKAILPGATSSTSSIDAVKMAQTYEIATQAFELTFERAGDPRMENRIKYAAQVLAANGSSVPGGSPDTFSGCGGGAGIVVDGYAFPLAPQTKREYSNMPCDPPGYVLTYTDRYGKSTPIRTCHHDKTPAFDLSYGGVENANIYAITDGVVEWISVSNHPESGGGQTCENINLRADREDDKTWYWYGHILTDLQDNTPVKAGAVIGKVAPRSYGPRCWQGGPHLHIDRGCIIGDDRTAPRVPGRSGPQSGGNDACRDPAFLDDLKAIWDSLKEED